MPRSPDFREARRLLEKYYQQKRHGSPHDDLMAEAMKRLKQLDWIVHRVARLEEREDRGWRQTSNFDTKKAHARWADRNRALVDEIELLTEGFYYVAWRFREILHNHLDGFRKFDPKGIRIVRNDLLEHPKLATPSFLYGANRPFGPVLKPFRRKGSNAPHDQGLYRNASELLDALVSKLQRATDLDCEKGGGR